MNICHVYIDRKPDGTPFYVGIGTADRVRYLERNRWHSNVCKKYPTWSRTIVETASRELCAEFEALLISEIGRKDLKTGTLVNLTDGGEGSAGYIHTEQTRKVIGAASAATPRTAEWKAKMSKSLMGRSATMAGKTHTPEARLKMSIAGVGVVRGMSGKTHSEETKQKMAEKAKGRTHSEQTKKLFSILFTGRPSPTKGSIWINNGSTNKRVSKEQLLDYLAQGWTKGQVH